MASLDSPAACADKKLRMEIISVWNKYEKKYYDVRDDYISKFLTCDNHDEAARLTKDFGKRTSDLLAGTLDEVKQCMASRIADIENGHEMRFLLMLQALMHCHKMNDES